MPRKAAKLGLDIIKRLICLSLLIVSITCAQAQDAEVVLRDTFVKGGLESYENGNYGQAERLFKAALVETQKIKGIDKQVKFWREKWEKKKRKQFP